jgi:hypothetical protein
MDPLLVLETEVVAVVEVPAEEVEELDQLCRALKAVMVEMEQEQTAQVAVILIQQMLVVLQVVAEVKFTMRLDLVVEAEEEVAVLI